jgi:hypothetical protein
VEPALKGPIVQDIANGRECHSLMMGHPASDQFAFTGAEGAWARGREIGGFKEAKISHPMLAHHKAKIGHGAGGVHHQCKATGIGRDDKRAFSSYTQGQTRHAEGGILIIPFGICLAIGGF